MQLSDPGFRHEAGAFQSFAHGARAVARSIAGSRCSAWIRIRAGSTGARSKTVASFRTARAPWAHGGVYYSGLMPETDLFVYDGPAFLHIEAKDWSGLLSRSIVTEFWARALDLHLGLSGRAALDAALERTLEHWYVSVRGASRSLCLCGSRRGSINASSANSWWVDGHSRPRSPHVDLDLLVQMALEFHMTC